LRTLPGGIGFDYNWDNTGMSGQLNTFYKMSFEGGAYGCRVGVGGHMCDTSTWIDCAFLNATEAGLLVGNLNSMAHRVIGGNFQGNRIGIYVTAGAVQSIVGAGFQASKEWDIKLDGGATDTYAITGISTESTNFVTARNVAIGLTLVGCAQRSTSPGTFVAGAGMVHIEGCWSLQGIVTSGNNLTAKNCFFNRHDANYYSGPVPVVKIDNCLFGDSINSVARRDVDVVVTPAGRRTHRIEGATLTDASVVNGGVNINLEGGSNSVPVVVSIADPAVVILAWHGFSAGVPVAFTTTGELPTGLRTTVTYYVLADGLTTDRFRISASAGGSAIATSGSQSGTHSIYLVRVFTVGDQILNSGVAAGGSPGWICTTAGPALGVAVFKPMANVAA
jgi:hypothetical protein